MQAKNINPTDISNRYSFLQTDLVIATTVRFRDNGLWNRAPINPAELLMTKYTNIRAYILAGGKASRLGGEAKGLIEIDGQPLILRIARMLEGRMPVSVVSRRADDFSRIGLPVVGDLQSGRGPLGGLEAGLTDSDRPYNLFLPCDMPNLTWPVIKPLVDACSGHDVTIYRHQHYEPLVAVYSQKCLPHISDLIMEGRLKIINLLERVDSCVIPTENREAFFNINTPKDLAQLQTKDLDSPKKS